MAQIKLRRGKRENLPDLAEAEPAFTTDSKELYIGSNSGNIQLAKNEDVEKLKGEIKNGLKVLVKELDKKAPAKHDHQQYAESAYVDKSIAQVKEEVSAFDPQIGELRADLSTKADKKDVDNLSRTTADGFVSVGELLDRKAAKQHEHYKYLTDEKLAPKLQGLERKIEGKIDEAALKKYSEAKANLLHRHKTGDVVGLTEFVQNIDKLNNVNTIHFNESYTQTGSESPFTLFANTVDGTIDIRLYNNATLQVGQELHFYGKASGNILNGELCQFAGVQGDHILIKKAVAAEIITSPHFLVGVATQNIADGTFGYVTWFGKVNGVYTKTPANNDSVDWAAGDILYFDNSTGRLTNTQPQAPERMIIIAAVIKEQTGASETGIILVRPTFGMKLEDLDNVDGIPPVDGDILEFQSNDTWEPRDRVRKTQTDFDEFKFGFVMNYAGVQETTIGFDGTNTFTLAPTGTTWSYYRNGSKNTITGSKTAILTATPPAAKGRYYIYIDSDDGTLICSNSGWTLKDTKVPVAEIVWDNSLTPKYWLSDERHTCAIDRRFHFEHHFTDGTEMRTGPVLNGYSIAPAVPATTDNTFSISESVAIDEDIEHTVAAVADPNGITTPYIIWYRTAASTWNWVALEVPYRYTAAGYIQFDNAGTMTEGQNNRYYNTYLLVTNQSGAAGFSFISGQSEFTTLALAQAESFSTLTKTGLGVDEYVACYQLTWYTNSSYSSLGKCRLAVAPKAISISASGTTTGGSIEHNTLSGLQGGTTGEYYHLTSAEHTVALAAITASSTSTLTNKRITPRVTTITSSATPTINTDNCDAVTITALGTNITSMTTNLTGTPSNFDKLLFRIKDDGSARTIAWGASFVARGVSLPTTTTAGKVTTVGFIYNSVAAVWDCVAAVTEA